MASESDLSSGIITKLPDLLREAKSRDEFKRLQCVWLRFKFNFSTPDIAMAVGWNDSSVRRVLAKARRDGMAALIGAGRGGRHNEYLTWDEEQRLVDFFVKEAMQAKIVIVDDIKRTYEHVIGRRVPRSTIYRMLKRHKWRKLMPGSIHPKADEAAQERFKKNAPTNCR